MALGYEMSLQAEGAKHIAAAVAECKYVFLPRAACCALPVPVLLFVITVC